jgi:formate dehydrogenase maturation protein FdhE
VFDDIIDIKKSGGGTHWDFSKYEEDGAYCPVCGSKNVKIIREQLLSDHMEKDIRCNKCNMEWREIWNKDIELELESLVLDA